MTIPLHGQVPVTEGEVLASKYRVERLIGQGGMGVVVAATHIELDQLVALKFLLPAAVSNEEVVGRFLREAKASVKLKGAHVAKVLDVGRLEDGRPYIVMEYLEGRDLGAELKHTSEPIEIETAVGWILQACEGLSEAHSHGIVHRDLKPANLFLTHGVDGRPLVKVLDFGISKTTNPSIQTDGLSLTKTEMLLGSPLYMSPEQMRSSKYVDDRADIWGLGAIAYELLTRHVPFEADTLLDLCFKVAQEDPPAATTHRADLPEGLNDAIMRCLSKDPTGRYTSVAELAAALEPFATARDRGVAERASAVLAARPRARAPSLPDQVLPVSPTPTPKTSPTTKNDKATKALPPASSSSANDVASPASAAWGTTNATLPEKSRRGLIAVIAAGLALVAAVAIVVAKGRTPTPTAIVAATSSPLEIATTATPGVPPPATAIETVPPPQPAVSAPTTSPRPTSAPQVPTAPKHRPAAPSSAASSTAKPPASSSPGGFIRERE